LKSPPAPTVFFDWSDAIILAEIPKTDRLIRIVGETQQIPNRRISPLNSRAQISDGSGRRFFVVRGKSLRCQINALPWRKTIEWEQGNADNSDCSICGPPSRHLALWFTDCKTVRSLLIVFREPVSTPRHFLAALDQPFTIFRQPFNPLLLPEVAIRDT
jgi:hypothetical protein